MKTKTSIAGTREHTLSLPHGRRRQRVKPLGCSAESCNVAQHEDDVTDPLAIFRRTTYCSSVSGFGNYSVTQVSVTTTGKSHYYVQHVQLCVLCFAAIFVLKFPPGVFSCTVSVYSLTVSPVLLKCGRCALHIMHGYSCKRWRWAFVSRSSLSLLSVCSYVPHHV